MLILLAWRDFLNPAEESGGGAEHHRGEGEPRCLHLLIVLESFQPLSAAMPRTTRRAFRWSLAGTTAGREPGGCNRDLGGCTGLLASPLPGRVWLNSGGITACPSGCVAPSSSSLCMATSSPSLYRTTAASCRLWARTPGGRRPCTSPGGPCWPPQPTSCTSCSPLGKDARHASSLHHRRHCAALSVLQPAAVLACAGVIGPMRGGMTPWMEMGVLP